MTSAITVARTFAAPREAVWDAFVRPQHFATWFGTEHVKVPLETLTWNAEPGKPWSAVMHLPDGTTKSWVGTFIDVERPTRLAFTMTDVPDEPQGATPVTVQLQEVTGGTAVTLTQETPGFTFEQREAVTAGYNAFFDTLGSAVLGLD